MDALCGTSESYFNATAPLSSQYKSNGKPHSRPDSGSRTNDLKYSYGCGVVIPVARGRVPAYIDRYTDSFCAANLVIAAVTFGDPSHVINLAWDAGTSKKNGVRVLPENPTLPSRRRENDWKWRVYICH